MSAESLRVEGSLTLAGVTPGAIVTPPDRAAFAQTVGELYAAGTSFAFFGGGTERDLGNAPRALDTLVCTAGLDRVIEYAPRIRPSRSRAG